MADPWACRLGIPPLATEEMHSSLLDLPPVVMHQVDLSCYTQDLPMQV